MKLKNIVAIPVALVADAITCGNIGGNRSFTQQVFDRDRHEEECDAVVAILKALARRSVNE